MVVTLNNLSPVEGATKKPKKRLGRGQGSGKGGTSTRGHKGAKSRSGYAKKIGFEGGQMPLQRRIPKFGFKNINRKEYAGINLDVLCALVEHKKVQDKIDPAILKSNGIVSSSHKRIKILARGGETLELKGIKVYAHKFSKKAKEIIEKAGGEAINLIKSSKE